MTEDQPTGRAGSTEPEHDAVPHPFGPGRLGERPADPEIPDTAPDGEPPPDPEAEAESEAESEAEPEVDGEPARETEPAAAVEPETPDEPEVPAAADMAAQQPAAAEPTTDADRPRVTVRARRRRDPLAAALIGVLTLLLGFAFAVQVRNNGNDQALSGAREEDLVRILDDLNAREERLREQISDQRTALSQLTSSDSQSATALEEARKRAEAIGILNGTVAAEGPGLTMSVRDPQDGVRVADVLDAIQELRGAGAETMQIDGVRVGVSTAVTGTPGNLLIDGRPISSPYEFVVIGSPQNMETAMNIPGGVVPRFTSRGATVDIKQSDKVVVDALRPLDTPQYASPDTGH
jgi:uncharacterized protein YlxW (UPF0749 family)